MKAKHKALLFNFIGFAALFLTTRLVLGFYVQINTVFLAIISAVVASVLSPKFGAVKTKEGEKLYVKWLFIKGAKAL